MQTVVIGTEIRYDYQCENQHAVIMLVDGMVVIELEFGDCVATATTPDFITITYSKKWYCKLTKRVFGLGTKRGKSLHQLTKKVCNIMYPMLMEINRNL